MGYALFAKQKLVLDAELNCYELQQAQRSNEQYVLATQETGMNQRLTTMTQQESQELSDLYDQLSSASDSTVRESINAEIQAVEENYEAQMADIQNEIYDISIREEAIELAVKRLDTKVTAVQSRLEAVEDAEADGIDRATPKFKGLG